MTLEIGDVLPVEIRERIGSRARYQVLYFMRTADCSVCRSHVRRLVELAPKLRELDAALTVFAPDEHAPAWAKDLPIPMVLGPRAYELTGFHRTLGAIQQSGTVTARRDGQIVNLRRSTLPFQAFNERELLNDLQGFVAQPAP